MGAVAGLWAGAPCWMILGGWLSHDLMADPGRRCRRAVHGAR